MLNKYSKYLLAMLILSSNLYASPIDWHGKLGAATTIINNYNLLENSIPRAVTDGSQEINPATGNHENASFQHYIFSLRPDIIINDAATIKAEMTTGHGRGGILGDDTKTDARGDFNHALYAYNTSDSNPINLTQFYLELYGDTATYQIGRHSRDWGMGALYNSGKNLWDRHYFSQDGITMKIKIDNFYVSPFWARISASNAGHTRINHTNEYGASLLYDNPDKNYALGLMYTKKENGSHNDQYTTDASVDLGTNSIKVLDIYFRKSFSNFKFELEVPLLSGDLGYFYSSTQNTQYKAKAILAHSEYKGSTWGFGAKAGLVTGDDGSTSSFKGMYLNPNYKIANLLFNYNLNGINNSGTNPSVFDSYVTNTQFLKLWATYNKEQWVWDMAIVYAKADQTAKVGDPVAFNHQKVKTFVPAATQKDDLGIEIDLGFKYKWNNEISVHGNSGYLMTGDYFAFTNDPSIVNQADNAYLLELGIAVEF